MSHWTKVKLQISDEETLVRALKRMGCGNVHTGSHRISQYGTTDTASVWVDEAVGFKEEADGTYSMIGDFYHSNDRTMRNYYGNNDKFQRDLNAAYGIEDAIMKVESLGYGFELTGNPEAVEDEDGLIRLQFETYQEIS